ncbi:MAG: hypothetical protein U9Q82_09360, partial [Chloroflexota bacterium]|nr:hypothetical protein [Chloroflexota bacterium]
KRRSKLLYTHLAKPINAESQRRRDAEKNLSRSYAHTRSYAPRGNGQDNALRSLSRREASSPR